MSKKTAYEKPKAQVLSFRLEEELMSGGADLNLTSDPTVGGGAGVIPFSNDDGVNDKSSYQLD